MGEAHDHYFSAEPNAASRRRSVVVSERGLELTLVTDRGTFSPDRIDPGTSFLLSAAPDPPARGRLVDLGCGYGPIACTLAALSPDAEVIAVDVNQRSRDLCRENAAALGLDNIAVVSPDDYPGDGPPVDLIWSNPPIRIGKAALHELLLCWLGRLAPTGTAVMVVNRHLGADSLQRWLGDRGFPARRLASKKGYRLLGVAASDPGRVDRQA